MDNKKLIKDFINYICNRIEAAYKDEDNTGFIFYLRDDKRGYLIADKGIEKRIEKQLYKKLSLKSKVEYDIHPLSYNTYIDGRIRIRLYP